jgi:hypothetical protein
LLLILQAVPNGPGRRQQAFGRETPQSGAATRLHEWFPETTQPIPADAGAEPTSAADLVHTVATIFRHRPRAIPEPPHGMDFSYAPPAGAERWLWRTSTSLHFDSRAHFRPATFDLLKCGPCPIARTGDSFRSRWWISCGFQHRGKCALRILDSVTDCGHSES